MHTRVTRTSPCTVRLRTFPLSSHRDDVFPIVGAQSRPLHRSARALRAIDAACAVARLARFACVAHGAGARAAGHRAFGIAGVDARRNVDREEEGDGEEGDDRPHAGGHGEARHRTSRPRRRPRTQRGGPTPRLSRDGQRPRLVMAAQDARPASRVDSAGQARHRVLRQSVVASHGDPRGVRTARHAPAPRRGSGRVESTRSAASGAAGVAPDRGRGAGRAGTRRQVSRAHG